MSIAKAEAEVRELQEKVQRFQAVISEAEGRISDLSTYIRVAQEFDGNAANASAAAPNQAGARDSAREEREESRPARARRLSIEAVTEAGHALRTAVLVERLGTHGLTFGYGDPKLATADLSGILKREPRLRNVSRSVGWGLAEWNGKQSAAEADAAKAPSPDPEPSSTQETAQSGATATSTTDEYQEAEAA